MKCSGENVILRGIVHVVSGFPLHFKLYGGNLDCFSNRVDMYINTPKFFIFADCSFILSESPSKFVVDVEVFAN